MKLPPLWVGFRKELMDGLRDRRSIFSALLPLAFIPVVLYFGLTTVADQVESDRNIKVPVVGAEHGQPLVEWLDRQPGIEIEAGPADALDAVDAGEAGFVLEIPEDFGKRFSRSKPARVRIVVDGADQLADRASSRIRRLIEAYSGSVGSQRLIARGVSPDVIRPLRVETVNLQSDRERAAKVLNFMPMVLLMATFLGGLQIAIDSTAGERERGSLERLLLNPVPRLSIVTGKWLAAVTFSWASVGLGVAALWFIADFSPLQRIGLRLDLGATEVAGMVALALPLAPALAALQMAVATMARSYKEAQSYVSFLIFLPILPMLATMNAPPDPETWSLFVPVFGQYVLMLDVIEGEALGLGRFAITTLVALATASALLLVTERFFRSERIVFGRST